MKKLNNLKNETSPYLLQHVENPVNWNPWDTKSHGFQFTGFSTC